MDDVALPDGLAKRRGSNNWYFRMRCPAHLLERSPRGEAMFSLNTPDYRAALKLLDGARVKALEQFKPVASGIVPSFARLVRKCDGTLAPLKMDEAASLAIIFFHQSLRDLDAEPPYVRMQNPQGFADRYVELEHRNAVLAAPDADDDDLVLSCETSLLLRMEREAPSDSEPSRLLREYLRRALLQLGAIEKARLSGDYTSPITDLMFVGTPPKLVVQLPLHPNEPSGITVREAVERYMSEMAKKVRHRKTQDRYKDELKHIVGFLGAETRLSSVRRQQCVELRDTFALLPPNFARKLHGDESVRDLVDRRKPDDPVLAWATHEKYLSALSRFVSWASQEDYLEKNYAEGLKPLATKPDGSIAKLPFEDEELMRIFARPIYLGCRDDGRGFAKSGTNIVRRSRYWAPLIALFAGLRAGEILQLTPEHFRTSPGGTPFIVLTPDMQLKNLNAQREIPVHPTLIQIGLLSWVDRRRGKSLSDPLFPEVSKDKYDAESPIFSKRFRSDLKHFQLGERRDKLTFHSLRHTFKRALDRADVSEQQKDELCGWARGKKTGRRYGTGLEADGLRAYLERVAYDIDLRHLYGHSALLD